MIAVNPYFEVKHYYTHETITKYKGKSLGVMPPHVFAIGEDSVSGGERGVGTGRGR